VKPPVVKLKRKATGEGTVYRLIKNKLFPDGLSFLKHFVPRYATCTYAMLISERRGTDIGTLTKSQVT
jgi:hypothetical protein